MIDTTTPSLRERAIAAYRADQERRAREETEAEERARQNAEVRLRQLVEDRLGLAFVVTEVRLHRHEPDGYWIASGVVDGLPLVPSEFGGLALRYTCPTCGRETTGESFGCLEDLGGVLERYEAGAAPYHTCWRCLRARKTNEVPF